MAASISELVTVESDHFSTKTAHLRLTLFTGYRERVEEPQVEVVGQGPRVVLVHGSVGNAPATWAQQRELADRYTLVLVTRPGYPPGPPRDRIDFAEQAEQVAPLLQPGDHLVGHSYGGVISLLAASQRPDALRSLTVNEPPAFGIARGDPAVEDFLARFPNAPREPRAYLEFFLPLVGSNMKLPDPLPPELDAGARAALAERPPHEAEIPLGDLAAAPFPKLVVSGGHSAAFDAVCDVLERELNAERAVVAGAGHSIPRAPGYNEALLRFLESA
ncbi:MAG: alpha/beta hydrolase [Actinobacteria bacterium]|nr:MAG: alpha/beta hydrolase [Actinomycetota bacterium]